MMKGVILLLYCQSVNHEMRECKNTIDDCAYSVTRGNEV